MFRGARKIPHERHVLLGALLAGAPGVVVALWLLWVSGEGEGHPARVQWTLSLLIVGCWLGFAFAVQDRVVRPLQTMANLLSALREGDFSIRARGANHDDALGDLLSEINTLSATLRAQRLDALEASALLRTVMQEIDVAIFAFDASGMLRLINRAGQDLLAAPADKLLGRSAEELGLTECIAGPMAGVLQHTIFPGGQGRRSWGMRRTRFRESGLPHDLVVVADLSEALREEELRAWQRLVRVMGHEINNSLAPIKSIAGSLGDLVARPQPPVDLAEDLARGLHIIQTRAEGLSRFMQAYARFAKLPKPNRQRCAVAQLVGRVAQLERRHPVEIEPGPDLTLACDEAQIEQVLINLVKNAVEATLAENAEAPVVITWRFEAKHAMVEVVDAGPGIEYASNLFVPFFTTKPEGSGIGLILSRQIAENHGGSLALENRAEVGASGCRAILRLPLG